MTSSRIASASLFAVLLLAGCQANPNQPVPAQPVVSPFAQPVQPSDAAKQEDERIKREITARKHKGQVYDLNKTDAYKNYVP
jgi:uncharacterized lipoprotein YajG